MESPIDRLSEQANNKRDSVIGKIESIGDSVASTRTWTLTILVTFAALVFGTKARGFGRIQTPATAPIEKRLATR